MQSVPWLSDRVPWKGLAVFMRRLSPVTSHIRVPVEGLSVTGSMSSAAFLEES